MPPNRSQETPVIPDAAVRMSVNSNRIKNAPENSRTADIYLSAFIWKRKIKQWHPRDECVGIIIQQTDLQTVFCIIKNADLQHISAGIVINTIYSS